MVASIKTLLKSVHIIFLFFIISLASIIFPILIFLEIGLALYFVVRRIRFFIKNIHAVILGLFVYIAPILITINISKNYLAEEYLYYIIITTVSLSLIAHYGLKYLYNKGYNFRDVIEIMSISPLLVISLILPLLKLEIMFGETVEVTGIETSPEINPNTHEVSAYTRISPDGHVQHVSSYLRTDPDGIVENNISYHENSPPSINQTAHGNEHIRTIPEGISRASALAEGYQPNKGQENIAKDSLNMASAEQKKENLHIALRQLPFFERKLLILIYSKRCNLQSIADDLGCTLNEINIHHENARRLLKHKLLLAAQNNP